MPEPERPHRGPHAAPAARQRPGQDAQSALDADGEPLGVFTSNFPIWMGAAVLAAFAAAALISGSEWIALGLAVATVLVAAGALANGGRAAERSLEGQPTTKQFACPFAALLAGLVIAAVIGVLVIVV